MKKITSDLSFKESTFLVKQQEVYLEKEILAARKSDTPYYLAFVRKNNWKMQLEEATFSGALNEQIDSIRSGIENGFNDHLHEIATDGHLSVRFFDLDMLSLLFVGCPEAEAVRFTEALKNKYECNYAGTFVFEHIAVPLFEKAYNSNDMRSGWPIKVGLSYQQNYLANVVSRDRQESLEELLTEAVDQVIYKYHRV